MDKDFLKDVDINATGSIFSLKNLLDLDNDNYHKASIKGVALYNDKLSCGSSTSKISVA